MAIYVTVGLLCLFENAFPPLPTDIAFTLAAFLAARGQGAPEVLFAIAASTNTIGAMGVAFAARRLGRAFLGTPAGHRLISPRALTVIESEYLRHGVAGVCIARLLPGIRAVVPPFAGIFAIPLGRVGVALAVASAVWYGALLTLATSVTSQWDTIVRVLGEVNRTLGVVTLVLIAAVATGILLRRRRAVRQLGAAAKLDTVPGLDEREAARLVIEIAYADPSLSEAERAEVSHHLRARWGLEAGAESGAMKANGSDRVLLPRGLRRWLGGNLGHDRRIDLVERLWSAAFADGAIGAHEEWLLRRASELLALSPEEVRAVRTRMLSSGRGGTA